jgi:hypothetical protein
MIVFYSNEGKFIASVQNEEGGILVEGDTDFLMKICQGRATYSFFKANFAKAENELYQSLEIPDNSKVPPNVDGAMALTGSNSTRTRDADKVLLNATHEFDGEAWAEVGFHSLISESGSYRQKQEVLGQYGFLNYSQFDGKFGLKSPLASRPLIAATNSTFELARDISTQIQYLVDIFDAIPADDVEQRANFSWNDGETTEMLYEMGELPTRYETPPYH